MFNSNSEKDDEVDSKRDKTVGKGRYWVGGDCVGSDANDFGLITLMSQQTNKSHSNHLAPMAGNRTKYHPWTIIGHCAECSPHSP